MADLKEYLQSTEYFVYNVALLILTVARLLVMLICMREAQLFIKHQLGRQTDNLTILMFTALGLSALSILVYRILYLVDEVQ